MTATASSSQDQRALRRARQAVRCLPFQMAFYRELDHGALSSGQLASRDDWRALCGRRLNAGRIEDHLIWLIQLGVLRREVDGQGLTERVRLTPLGRQTLAPWGDQIPPARLTGRLRHWLRRSRPRL